MANDPRKPGGYRMVITTGDNQSRLDELAQTLVRENLVACGQISGPIQSHYRWQGKLHCDTEWRCLLKTSIANVDAVKSRIEALHDYDVPQIVVIEISETSDAYGDWIDQQTSKTGS